MANPTLALRRGLAATLLVGSEAAAVAVLARLGRAPGFAVPADHVAHWLRHSPTEVLVAGSGRIVGLVVAAWLLLTTVLSILRRIVPAWRRVQALDSATPVAVRRLLDRTLAVGLGASLVLGGVRPAGAATRGAVPAVAAAPAASTAEVPVPRVPPATPTRVTPPAAAAPRASPATAGAVVVRPGDNLWAIAQRAVGSHEPGLIAPYWRAVVAANAATIRSGDPNLIYPGERIVLPPAGAAPKHPG